MVLFFSTIPIPSLTFARYSSRLDCRSLNFSSFLSYSSPSTPSPLPSSIFTIPSFLALCSSQLLLLPLSFISVHPLCSYSLSSVLNVLPLTLSSLPNVHYIHLFHSFFSRSSSVPHILFTFIPPSVFLHYVPPPFRRQSFFTPLVSPSPSTLFSFIQFLFMSTCITSLHSVFNFSSLPSAPLSAYITSLHSVSPPFRLHYFPSLSCFNSCSFRFFYFHLYYFHFTCITPHHAPPFPPKVLRSFSIQFLVPFILFATIYSLSTAINT